MATEAQRLMMVSLGKIQGCRQQKGGLNLHKSLLVSKVLYRARSVCLSETSPTSSPKKQVEEDQCVPDLEMQNEQSEKQREPDTHVVDADVHVTQPEQDFDDDTQDKENSKPIDSNITANENISENVLGCKSDNSDNNRPPAARCVKRRLTEVEQAVESISPKKQKLEENDCSHEPMQVEQISSLVNRFSSGFTGLLATDTDSYSHEPEEEDQTVESSLLSCSTQIKESFELLARPIALSVWTKDYRDTCWLHTSMDSLKTIPSMAGMS